MERVREDMELHRSCASVAGSASTVGSRSPARFVHVRPPGSNRLLVGKRRTTTLSRAKFTHKAERALSGWWTAKRQH